MRSLLFGILIIVLVGFGGLIYRNIVEHPNQQIACPVDALVCPDGTSVSRIGTSCTFPACKPPNVSFSDIDIAFAVPDGFVEAEFPDAVSVAAYEKSPNPPAGGASTSADSILIRHYDIAPGSTALETIQQTAIGGASGLPVPLTAFSSTVLGTHRFTVVSIERFEGVIDTAYYLARNTDIVRFDAIDRDVFNWTDSNLDISTLPANAALRELLGTLQGA